MQGDVVGVGYRPRTGTIFFTRNGKKLDDVVHGLKTQNFFPSVGANGPCTVHVNFGQSGFVFIEANVKKWGLAPITGSLAPPPPYGSEQGSILLEAGGEQPQYNQQQSYGPRHSRTRSRFAPVVGGPMSPGPVRSPTEISLAHLAHIPTNEDAGEGTSGSRSSVPTGLGLETEQRRRGQSNQHDYGGVPPPEYSSPHPSPGEEQSGGGGVDRSELRPISPRPQVPSYDDAMAHSQPRGSNAGRRGRRREGEHPRDRGASSPRDTSSSSSASR